MPHPSLEYSITQLVMAGFELSGATQPRLTAFAAGLPATAVSSIGAEGRPPPVATVVVVVAPIGPT